jgi:hypothetical protein
MTNQTQFLVYFSCLFCEAIYGATQERKPSTNVGHFTLQKVQNDGASVVPQPIQLHELDRSARHVAQIQRLIITI